MAIVVKRFSMAAVRRMNEYQSHVYARAQTTVEEYVDRVCDERHRGKLMSSAACANMLITISIFQRDYYEKLCIAAAEKFKHDVIDGEFRNMGKYVDNGDAWLPRTYTFLCAKDQASLRAVAKFGRQHGRDNVDRNAIRISAQNIYAMLDQMQPLKKRLELQRNMRKIMCGTERTALQQH